MNLKIHRILKDKKVDKLWQKLFNQIRLNEKSRFIWEKEKHTTISQMSWCMLDCRSMSVKSSTGGCLSNSAVKVFCNCWERTFNIACRTTLPKKNLSKQRRKSFWSNCSLVPLFLKKKNENENTYYYDTFISFKSHLYWKQASPIFLLFGSWNVVLHFQFWVSSKISRYLQPASLSRRSMFAR